MSYEDRFNLEIAIARGMTRRYMEEQSKSYFQNKAEVDHFLKSREESKRAQQRFKQDFQKGKDEEKERNISLLIQGSDWTDQKIAEVLQIPIELVQKIRQNIDSK